MKKEKPTLRKGKAGSPYVFFKSFFICTLLIVAANGYTQEVYAFQSPSRQNSRQQQKINLHAKDEKLSVILDKIEKQVAYVFVYSNDDVNATQRISVDVNNADITDVMQIISKQIDKDYEVVNDKIILRSKQKGATNSSSQSAANTMSNLESATTYFSHQQADIVVNGKVMDDKGAPISGASVTLKGTKTGTITDENGNYTLRIADEQSTGTLVFSSVGFTAREEPINGRKAINITLVAADNALNDVVVVGYSTQKRSSVTGAVDVVGHKALEDRPVTNLTLALQGTSPNLIIQQNNFEPGQSPNLNIRGLGTLGDNTPLVVIDGILGGDINLINPNDVATISILKDAGAAAIYGSRAANGVILITTKKGSKNTKPTVSYSGNYGIQSPRITYKPVDAWENAYYKNVSLVNSGLAPAYTPEQIQAFMENGNGDWRVENIVHDAPQQSHNITVNGGGANSTYLLSAGYLNQQNNFVGPDYGYKRYNVRLNLSNDIGKLKLNTIVSYTKVQNKDHSFNAGTLMVDASRVPLYYSFQDTAGNYLTNPVSAELNPKGILEKGGYRKHDDDEFFGNFSAEYSITKDLKVRGLFGGTIRSNNEFDRVMPISFTPGGSYGSNRDVGNVNSKSLFTNVQLIAQYTKEFGNHNIDVLVGGSNESFDSKGSALFMILTDPALGIPTTGTTIDPARSYTTNDATTETSLNSLFGRVSYNYNQKYFAEFNFREDASSKFAAGNRAGFFPSGSLAWRVSEEDFMQNIRNSISNLKLRASYGVLGNQNVNAYQYQTTFFNYPNAYGFNNNVVGGAGYTLGNPDLTWERAATFNAGVDAGFFNDRLSVSFDYFDKTTSDILYQREDVPQLFGAGFPSYNVAKVRNRGWEAKATYNIPGKTVVQTISANIADNLNELLELTSGATEQVLGKEEFQFLRRVGQPITMYYGYKRNGYFQNLDDLKGYPKFANQVVSPGDVKFVDRNGDGVIDDNDKFILGNPFPRYTFGFTYTIAVKGFDMLLFVQGVGKRDAMIRGEQVEPFHVGYGGTMYTHQTDFWTPTNPDAKWPKLSENGSADNANNYRTGSDIFLFNAAYARLKNLQVGYTIPQRITSKAGMSKVRIYFTGQNLLTLTKLSFLDPEITEFNNNTALSAGANSARAYFLPVFYGGGIDITF
ncbi:TonB-dependent receptor [Ilyomonas limi]|uniref:TonB-dependent receptor n=1 Tax=Ilyomonas limi TaxID=2575867 RepID=A0A4U3LAG3_9BACT|nr:TonB-dependent receptor [Ilyomonas limi]TKK71026.1 TonB-dependent receptor [Ilyomonas limi]